MRSASAIYCFNLEHPCLARSRRDRVASDTQRFHAASVAGVENRWSSNFFSTSCRACHVSSAAPACGSLRSGPRIVKASRSLATTLVKASPCRGPARLRSKGALLQRASCDARRARPRRGSIVRTCSTPTVLPPSGRALRLFAAAIPRWFFQTRLLRLGPRSRPRSNRCGRFPGPDAAIRTSATNFQWSTHEHESTSVILARRWGLPSGRCHARCAFHAGRAFLFFCKEGATSMRRSELRDFPRRWASRAQPRRAVKLFAPSSDTFQVGPKDMGNA